MAGYATIGLILLWGNWKDCLYFLTALGVGAFSGLEDVMYYILDCKPMPASLPWLGRNSVIYASSRTGVISSVIFWMGSLVVLYVVLYLWWRKPPEIALYR